MVRWSYLLPKLVADVLRRTELRDVARGSVQKTWSWLPVNVYNAPSRLCTRRLVTTCSGSRVRSSAAARPNLPKNPAGGFATDVTGSRPWYDLNYDDLLSLLNSKQIRVIDVRRRDETSSTGMMPGAINVPLDEIEKALKMADDDFAKLYGGKKPKQSDPDIVFSCLGGVRSRRALELAHKEGFSRARHYTGGWEEYSRRRSS